MVEASKKRGIKKRSDHTTALFFKRTISAQTHLLGFVIAAIGLAVLLDRTQVSLHTGQLRACIAYGITAMLVFIVSATYHFLHDGFDLSDPLAVVFDNFDHSSIYLFIAGTYTPVILNTLPDDEHVIALAVIWTIAITGIVYTLIKRRLPAWARHRFVSTALFVLMGWTAILKIQTVVARLSEFGVAMLLAGAAAYSIGAVVYAFKKPNPRLPFVTYHEIWHVLVLLGFFFHYLLVLDFYAR